MPDRMLSRDGMSDPDALRHGYNLLSYLWGGTSSLVNHPTRGSTKIMYLAKRKEVPEDGFHDVDRFQVLGGLLGMIAKSDDMEQLERVEELARNMQMPDGSLYQYLQLAPPDPATIKRENSVILDAVRSRIATLGNISRIGMWLRNAGKVLGDI